MAKPKNKKGQKRATAKKVKDKNPKDKISATRPGSTKGKGKGKKVFVPGSPEVLGSNRPDDFALTPEEQREYDSTDKGFWDQLEQLAFDADNAAISRDEGIASLKQQEKGRIDNAQEDLISRGGFRSTIMENAIGDITKDIGIRSDALSAAAQAARDRLDTATYRINTVDRAALQDWKHSLQVQHAADAPKPVAVAGKPGSWQDAMKVSNDVAQKQTGIPNLATTVGNAWAKGQAKRMASIPKRPTASWKKTATRPRTRTTLGRGARSPNPAGRH